MAAGDPNDDRRRSGRAGWNERLKFLGAMIRSPRRVGSVVPTGRPTANLMAGFARPDSGLPVLELGPGTGPITRAILARGLPEDRLHVIEYSADLCRHLRANFAGIDVIQGDAFDLEAALGPDRPNLFDCVISGVPLLNFGHAERNVLLNGALDHVPAGRPMVQITYGARPPVIPEDPSVAFRSSPWILRNAPPARVWSYWRDEHAARRSAAAA